MSDEVHQGAWTVSEDERRLAEAIGRRDLRSGWILAISALVFSLVGFAAMGSIVPTPLVGVGIALVIIGVWKLRLARRMLVFARGRATGDEVAR